MKDKKNKKKRKKMKPFSAKVRLYSKYVDQFSAPYGLNTKCKLGLQMEKWLHFPADRDITFQLRMLNDRALQIRVVSLFNNEVTLLEDITTSVVPDNMYVQFSVKSPAIACKYLTMADNQLFINRFQVTLGNDAEFLEVYQILRHLKFRLKCGRTIPSSNLAPFERFQDMSTINANKGSNFGTNQDIIHSQVFEDPNCNAYSPRGYSHASTLQAHSMLPSPTWGPEGPLSHARLHTAAPVEVIPDTQQRETVPSNLAATPLEFNNEKQSCYNTSEVAGPGSQAEVERITGCKGTEEPVKLIQTSLAIEKPDKDQQLTVPDGIDITTNTNEVSSPAEKEKSCSEGLSEVKKDPVVVDTPDGGEVVNTKAVEPKEAIEDRKSQNVPHRGHKKHTEDNVTLKKISKKLIREKLCDRKFMKWVDKVEQALETMIAGES